ncbi:uncharacterized protein LOC131529194 [Onychostoma macrolepis]|uniref:uncharacterized protein LOC131529194 n=1 Tax=Onychostoma macrolepis TaxID=369639 RepID=UPI00272B52BE|nr:uncharacterized protein LOC131529194 [Onychostoma macrolepis]
MQLVKEHCLVRKAWRKAVDHEKEGLKNLWGQIRAKLTNLRRMERIRKRKRRKEKARSSFFQDPFRYARNLLEEKKNGTLHITGQELEEYIKIQTSDSLRESPLGSPGHVLFGRNTLRLPLRSIRLGYKQEKVRLVFELQDSRDPVVQNAKAQVQTGSKWKATHAVNQAITHLKHQEVVGMVQHGRAGFGLGTSPKMWSKASKIVRKNLTNSEVVRDEEESYKIKAVSQGQQGRWTTWEAVSDRVLTWADLWRMPKARLSFLIRATYDTLPSPQN